NLYWMSRYVERAESVARLLDDGFHLELDAAELAQDPGGSSPVEGILTILDCRADFQRARGSLGPPEPAGPTWQGTGDAVSSRDAVLRFLTFDPQGSHSILSMVARARENARGTQEALSAEAWSQVNRLYLYLSGRQAHQRFQASPSRFFESIKRACVLFDGLVDSTLPRSEVFHFLQVGRYLERANMISRTLNARLHLLREDDASVSLPSFHWTSLLRSCSAYEAYL